MQQSTTLWYLFDFITREVSNTNTALEYSPLEATGKGLGEKEAHFNYFDGSCIQGFGNARHQDYSKTQWHDPLNGAQ